MAYTQEKSIMQTLKEYVTEYKAIYLVWKDAPFMLPKEYKTFEELKAGYKMFPDGVTEEQTKKWLLDEQMQKAQKYLMRRLHQDKMTTLYNKFYELALSGDVNAFKVFNDFSKEFFKDAGSSEIDEILNSFDGE